MHSIIQEYNNRYAHLSDTKTSITESTAMPTSATSQTDWDGFQTFFDYTAVTTGF